MKKASKMAEQATDQDHTTVSSVRQTYSNYGHMGHFTATDLRRVLGDPCEGVEVKSSGDFLMASRVFK
jgi:hypothetical protein